MGHLLRPATSRDATAVADVYLRSFRELIPSVRLAHTDEEVRAWIRERVVPSGQTIVAEREGDVVAMMVIERDPQGSWIHQLYVHPDHVGKGVGSELLRFALASLEPPVRLYTFQSNLRARRFYGRHGFREIARRDGSANEEGAPDALLAWAPER